MKKSSGQEIQRPPTLQGALEKKNMNSSHNSAFNLLALIVNPNSTCGKSGTLKFSHVKGAKVSKICDHIECLISNSERSLSLLSLLSLNIYIYIYIYTRYNLYRKLHQPIKCLGGTRNPVNFIRVKSKPQMRKVVKHDAEKVKNVNYIHLYTKNIMEPSIE